MQSQVTSSLKNILCFGDSLTWGWDPTAQGVPVERYPYAERWTGAMSAVLGADFHIIEEGLNGRTTSFDDPIDPRLNGSAFLPSALASHLPLDLVIVMLGTNDTKPYLNRSAFEIAAGMAVLLGQIAGCGGGIGTVYPAPRALLIAPPPLAPIPNPWFDELFKGGVEKSIELSRHYKALAAFYGAEFMNAGDYITTDGVDGIHLTAQSNVTLGKAVAEKVKAML